MQDANSGVKFWFEISLAQPSCQSNCDAATVTLSVFSVKRETLSSTGTRKECRIMHLVFFEHLLPAGWWNIAASRTDPSPCLRELVVWDTGGALSGEVRRPRVQRMITDAVEKTAGGGWLLGPKEVLG